MEKVGYNSGGYESLETLKLLDGAIDIYMPDAKFWEFQPAKRFCNAPDYPEIMKEALREMHRQVGDLKVGNNLLIDRSITSKEYEEAKQIARDEGLWRGF